MAETTTSGAKAGGNAPFANASIFKVFYYPTNACPFH